MMNLVPHRWRPSLALQLASHPGRLRLPRSPVMTAVNVRPFQRADRDQVTALVNAHAAAVVPGVVASVNAVLTQFEREPDEVVVGPWVTERQGLGAGQGGGTAPAGPLCPFPGGPDGAA